MESAQSSGIVGYRELPVVQRAAQKWRELTVATGGGPGSLEVVSVPEKAGGFAFRDYPTRFIYWKTQQGMMELVEENLDHKLQGNRLRIKLVSTPILGESVSFYESENYLVLLFSSVSSIHRIAFPHPSVIDKGRSVFTDVAPSALQDFHRPSFSGQITICSNYLAASNDAMFVLGTANALHLVTFYVSGEVSSRELTRHQTIKKRLTGMLPTVIRPKEAENEAPIAVACMEEANDFFVFAICQDQKICAWSALNEGVIGIESLPDLLRVDSLEVSNCQLKRFRNQHSFILRTNTCFAILNVGPGRNKGVGFNLMTKIPFTESNVIDFSADSSVLWVLYLNAEGETVMSSYDHFEQTGWQTVHWADPVNSERKTHVMDGSLSETYLDRIFRDDCFSLWTLKKTVAIFKRTEFGEKFNLPAGSLRTEILELIRLAIDKRMEGMVSEDEAQVDAYEKFLSYCYQYHSDGIKPLGLIHCEEIVALIRAEQIGFIQECDETEKVLLSQRVETSQAGSVEQFVDCLRLVNSNLDDEALDSLSVDIFTNNTIDTTVWQLAATINAKPDFKAPFIKVAKTLGKTWAESLSRLIVLIDSEVSYPVDSSFESMSDLFASPLGISVVYQNIYQRASLMYDLCRRLVIFEALLVLNHDKIGLPKSNSQNIKTELLNSTIYTMRCYFLVLWACEMSADPEENFNGRLNSLSIANAAQLSSQSIVELFLANDNTAVLLAQKKTGSNSLLSALLFEVTRFNCCLMSPSTESNYMLIQVLMEKQQYGPLQELIRLLEWDNARVGLKSFILGHALLKCGEIDSACQVFITNHEEAIIDPFVMDEINQNNPLLVSITYYQKIINLLEATGSSDHVILMARAALATGPPEQHAIELYSLIFRHELQQERMEKAIEALSSIPDREMQRGCLRELIGSSLDKKKHEVLVHFSQKSLREELLHIMTHRARSSDLNTETSLYDLLYCCHIHDTDFREAASIMFEQGLRLSREIQGLNSLGKQELCFLSAISCLQLLNDRGIVRPMARRIDDDTSEQIDGFMEVLELSTFERELALVQSWMKLAQMDQNLVTPISPEETVVLLIRQSMYDSAVQLCDLCKLDKSVLFEHVALACSRAPIELENATDIGPRNPEWILENTEFVNTVPKAAWFYLRHLLMKSEQTKYFRVCARVFLMSSCSLPPWFVVEYQKRNPAELLTVYVTFERFSEATELACRMIDRTLGNNNEEFNEGLTLMTGQTVWLPLHVIDSLQFRLTKIEGKKAPQLRERLLTKVDAFIDKVQQISEINVQSVF